MVYTIRVTSGMGTYLEKYRSYCKEFIGVEGVDWIYETYMWEYEFTFDREADAMMFSLKWKNV